MKKIASKNIVHGKKMCNDCRKYKPISEFNYVNGNTSDVVYLHSYCKKCQSVRRRAYRQKNLQRVKEQDTIYRKTHVVQERERKRRWSKSNPDKISAYGKKRYLKMKAMAHD